MEPQSHSDRTWLCTVVMMDIAGFSTQSVSQQIRCKELFNGVVGAAIRSTPARERLILDTGDGAAICFLGDPEDALFAAIELHEGFSAAKAGDGLAVRMGINLGPVKLRRDVNNNLNATGDAMNAAQRVMSFAKPDCTLVSRSFYEVVACLADGYEQMFRFDGIRLDKHSREHTVYRFEPPQGATVRVPREAKPGGGIPEPLIAQIKTELSHALGPVAELLVRRAASSASDARELIHLVAEELPDAGARKAFLARYGSEFEKAPAPAATAPPIAAQARVVEAAAPAIEALLAEHVGPLARILVKRAASRAASPEELIALLKDEIADSREQAAFCKRAGEIVSKLG